MDPSENGQAVARRARADLLEALGPARAAIESIDRQIAELQAAIDELRDVRRIAAKVADAVDPRPPAVKRGGDPRKLAAQKLERVEALREFLREAEIPAEGVTSTWLNDHAGDKLGLTKSAALQYLNLLADEGFLRVDRVGGVQGRTKFFKLTSEPEKVLA